MIRLATHDDLAQLCVLARIMHKESSFASMDFDIDVLKETIGRLIDESQFAIVAEGINGELVGGMLGQVTQSYFGKDFVANDLGVFVRPEQRKGLLGARLIRYFILWAKLAGAKQIRPGVGTGNAIAEKLYERLGFQRTGATFLMEGE